ncbi:DUF1929 domain-containing protein [Pseudarthrobacter sp. H3Y2-7]|uniref:galactose oxidase-like domain-containing protein n=1 Tax=Pseudarthrobacter naphthalenicus TaxID=3031328 RepID=UPI0023B2063A|nr:galactose oxidase-like domain-containing protein [Pseudarthrobacter sp. H3Y2-7]MDE8667811.1 DUF1929 domain-containing protein [Pseudarthrobacter sp. H3Y2-7]
MQLSATVQDTPGPTGPTAGVRQVEWWLYADKNQGAPTDFADQYPNNVEKKINLGMATVPASGTAANGTFQASFTVPSGGTIAVTWDGDHITPIPAGQTRTYQLPSGNYRVQAHLQDDEWLANPGTPGLTQVNTITLNTGTAAPAPTPPPSDASNLVVNGNYATGTDIPTCWMEGSWGTNSRSAALSASDVPAGSPAGTRSFAYTVTGYQSGDAKIMASDGTGCAPTVSASTSYTLGVQYKSTVATNAIPLFTATSTGGWQYWTTLSTLPAAGSWTQVTAPVPAIPAGTTRLSFGMAAVGNGTVMSTGWTLRGAPAPTPPPSDASNLVVNGNYATGTDIPTCWMEGSWGTNSRSAALSASDVPAGSPAGTRSFAYTVTGYQSGDAKIMASDGTGCAPTVSASTSYTLGVQYKSTVATNAIPLFTATSTGGWQYWTTLSTLPAAGSWTQVTAPVPAIPAGTTRLSFGMAAVGNGTVMSTGWTLTAAGATTPPPNADPRATTGEWQIASITLPNRGIHQTLLRDGRVLVISGSGNDEGNFRAGQFTTHVWNPITGDMTQIPTPEDMFCSGHVTLPDGRILIQGGTKAWWTPTDGFKGLRSSYIFDPATNLFTRTNDANEGHWYPTLTKLGNGNVWMGGGLTDQANQYGGHTTEMFNTATGSWLPTAQVPQTWTYWGEYPHMFLLGDGRLFYTGAHTFGDQRPGSGSSLYNWLTAQVADIPGLRDKDLRDHAGSVLLPPAQNQRFMIAGGGYIDKGAAPTNSVDLINMNDASPTWHPGPDLPGPGRQYVNLTNMFDRTVLASNGATGNRTGNISAASIFNPATDTWTTIPADPVGRNYHSMNLLLPDGRVMILGSNPIDGSVEMRVSIYNPPYLFRGTRPTVTLASASATFGQSLSLEVTGNVASASLTSPMSSTHQMDTNSRLVDLPITGTGTTRTAVVPSNASLLPPGPYMLTVMDDKGAVSVARWITIGR